VSRATRFVVYTMPRSGSAWLMEMLQGPGVVVYGELFHRNGEGFPSQYGSSDVRYFGGFAARLPRWAYHMRPYPCAAYLRRVYAPRRDVSAVGFKLMYAQADPYPELLPLLRLGAVRVVHLVRRNVLAAHVSYEVAKTADAFHPRAGEDLPRAMVTLDTTQLRVRLEGHEQATEAARARLRRLRLPTLEAAYEELVTRPHNAFPQVLGFIGAPGGASLLDSSLARTGGDSPSDRIANLQAVRRALSGTRFEWMLEGSR
jgi:LPS sulfotransferase NodH